MCSHKLRRPWSAIPSAEDVARAARAWEAPARALPGIDLHVDEQLELLAEIGRLGSEVELPAKPAAGWRYYHANGYYGYGDAIVLQGMLRRAEPSRIVEIGAGFSSALILDVADRFLDRPVDCTFVEPYPENRLLRLLRPEDHARVRIVRRFLQEIDLSMFDTFQAGDIVFIDSSHVSKMGSDVNLLLFEVIPRLPVGTWVHFHDIFYPFEYPPKSTQDRRDWSEAYPLRAFLEHNDAFCIRFFFDYLRRFHATAVERALPGSTEAETTNLWLQRVS